jgi:hypothetical protein
VHGSLILLNNPEWNAELCSHAKWKGDGLQSSLSLLLASLTLALILPHLASAEKSGTDIPDPVTSLPLQHLSVSP